MHIISTEIYHVEYLGIQHGRHLGIQQTYNSNPT